MLEEAGIEGVAPHSFRRTVAIVLDRAAGADLAAEMLGHTSSKVTKEHYIEPDEAVNLVTARYSRRWLRIGRMASADVRGIGGFRPALHRIPRSC